MRQALLLLGVAIVALCLAGCASDPTRGYAARSTFPAGFSTIAIQIFENETFDREIEFELADALVKEIEARTPYKVVRSSRADTILTGRISDVAREQLSKSRLTGLPEEIVVGVTLDFSWTDARTGAILEERTEFSGHGLFLPSAPSGEPIDIGRASVVQQLAKDIVDEMRAAW